MHNMKFPKNQLKKSFLKKKIQWLLVKYFCELLVALKLSTKSYLKNIGIFLFKWSHIRTEFWREGSLHWEKREEEGVMNSQFFILSQESPRSLDWTSWVWLCFITSRLLLSPQLSELWAGCSHSTVTSLCGSYCAHLQGLLPNSWWGSSWHHCGFIFSRLGFLGEQVTHSVLPKD